MYAFLVFILIILGIYLFYNPSSNITKTQQEGFQNAGSLSSSSSSSLPLATLPPIKPAEPSGVAIEKPWGYANVNAPVNATTPRIDPPPVRNKGQQPNPSDLPGEVPGAPYLQIARNDPRPYEDPTLVKTTVQRIKEIQENLKGFLAFKAQLISDRSDPQIQMPLSSARADFERLKSTLNVLSRNPDMQPTQTEQQMDEIADNLAYLQREAEKIQALSPGQEMPAPLKPSIFEGFENGNLGNNTYESVGCYKDSYERLIPMNDPTGQTWDNYLTYKSRPDAINFCFQRAVESGHKVFGVQDGGQCFSGPEDNPAIYGQLGESDNCKDGKGGAWANNIYRIVPSATSMPPPEQIPDMPASQTSELSLTNVNVGDVGMPPGHIGFGPGSVLLTTALSPVSLNNIYSANKAGTPYTVTVNTNTGKIIEFDTSISPIMANDNLFAFKFEGAPENIVETTEGATSATININKKVDPPPSQPEQSNYSLPSTVSNTGINDTAAATATSDRATVADLQDFHARVVKEQERLSRSGTTDPLIQARLSGLDRIRSDIDDIYNRIQNNQMREDEIPIKKSEIKDALRMIEEGGVPGRLSTYSANSLPSQAIDTALSQIMPGLKLIPPNALKRFLDNIKISFGINYSDSVGGILNSVGLPGVYNDNNESGSASVTIAPELPNPVSNQMIMSELNSSETAPPPGSHMDSTNYIKRVMHSVNGSTLAKYNNYNEEECRKACDDNPRCNAYNFRYGNALNSACTLLSGGTEFTYDPYTDSGIKKNITQGFENLNLNKSAAPYSSQYLKGLNSKAQFPMRSADWVYNGGQATILGSVGEFDWKERSKQITDQIRKRGMDPRQMGAIPEGAQVSPEFDWKGYSRMMCTRLEASFDTGLAVACGCPPHDWQGWQIPSRS